MRARCAYLALIVVLTGCGPSQEDIAASCRNSPDVQKCIDQNKAVVDQDLAKGTDAQTP